MTHQDLSRGPSDHTTTGVLYALGAFAIWGAFPLYFKALPGIPALEVLAHRVVWSALLVGLAVAVVRRRAEIVAVAGHWRRLGIYLISALLISSNWLIFIWAVTHDQVLQSSLGYYMTPLVNVVLGVLFLSERLSRAELGAILLAGVGVLGLAVGIGVMPWLGLALALTFGAYGLVRKKAGGDPLIGLLAETGLLTPLALGYLVWLSSQGDGAFGTRAPTIDVLLAASGIVTAVPLVLFAAATNRLRLATVGLLQYLTPTGQFLLAVFLYGEPFTQAHALAFACIWSALAIVSLDIWRRSRAMA